MHAVSALLGMFMVMTPDFLGTLQLTFCSHIKGKPSHKIVSDGKLGASDIPRISG